MSLEAWDAKLSEPDPVGTLVRFTGAGAAPVVKNFGRGVATTRTGVGLVSLVFDEAMGTFVGLAGAPSFSATTASGVKGYTCVPGDYNSTTRTLPLNITNAGETLADLAAAQNLTCIVLFKRTT